MSLLISIFVAVIFAAVCHKPLKKYPLVFYGIAFLISAFGIYFTWFPCHVVVIKAITFAIQKGHLGFAMLSVVMFIGVFAKQSVVSKNLTPVRAELSIVGSILIIGHFVPYLKSYLGMAGNLFASRAGIISAFFIALALLILLTILTVTSFEIIKKLMSKKIWKGMQKLAYLFYVLIFFHLAGFLLIPAINGSNKMFVSVVVYFIVLILYLTLRIRRMLIDRAAAMENEEGGRAHNNKKGE